MIKDEGLMLEFKSVTWRNFLSYGNYDTTLSLSDLGQCLITGDIKDNETNLKKSNGAGKSTIPNAIQWCLFGRTMHSSNPGDKVINYHTGEDCVVTVEFKNGDKITRTRSSGGNNELLFTKSGNEYRTEATTLSTMKSQQAQLSKMFNLDWEVFCGSVFFNQYGKPWMEMSDQIRKKAIERILHIDRFTYYAKIAKTKFEAAESKVEKIRADIGSLQRTIAEYEQNIERLRQASLQHSNTIKEKHARTLALIEQEQAKLSTFVLPDIDKLSKSWEIINKAEQKLKSLIADKNAVISELSDKQGTKISVDRNISAWQAKRGKVCSTCAQKVNDGHVDSKIDIIKGESIGLSEAIEELTAKRDKIASDIVKAQELISSRKPKMVLQEARAIHNSYNSTNDRINALKVDADKILGETNNYDSMIIEYQDKISKLRSKIENMDKLIQRDDFLAKHLLYVHKAYNDRTKIKSYVFQDHIPFINNRLNHYLEVFGLDVKIELTNSLSINSNMWGYDFESGGERKRTDVAFMLAMFDFHENMYGRQSNVLVLDEVDGRMDDDGIEALINIIKNDLASKVETILVISHRDMMFDTFSKEIKVTRDDRFSHIEVV